MTTRPVLHVSVKSKSLEGKHFMKITSFTSYYAFALSLPLLSVAVASARSPERPPPPSDLTNGCT